MKRDKPMKKGKIMIFHSNYSILIPNKAQNSAMLKKHNVF